MAGRLQGRERRMCFIHVERANREAVAFTKNRASGPPTWSNASESEGVTWEEREAPYEQFDSDSAATAAQTSFPAAEGQNFAAMASRPAAGALRWEGHCSRSLREQIQALEGAQTWWPPSFSFTRLQGCFHRGVESALPMESTLGFGRIFGRIRVLAGR